MILNDPIGDMLTRIRNAQGVRRETLSLPSSKVKKTILELLKTEGYIADYQVVQEGIREMLRVRLLYGEKNQPHIGGLRRVSKPGLRVYVDKKELPRFYGGRGMSVLSTSQGILTGREAYRRGIGGELLCYIW
ncbi:MAG: 30S ribosomal protein S8 [Chloroflexi bacterium]|nr:30S ribosomal protein S8 [Chloroflexota bacterium]